MAFLKTIGRILAAVIGFVLCICVGVVIIGLFYASGVALIGFVGIALVLLFLGSLWDSRPKWMRGR
jgi:hypothetical protein